jgi:hypothetical protein
MEMLLVSLDILERRTWLLPVVLRVAAGVGDGRVTLGALE